MAELYTANTETGQAPIRTPPQEVGTELMEAFREVQACGIRTKMNPGQSSRALPFDENLR